MGLPSSKRQSLLRIAFCMEDFSKLLRIWILFEQLFKFWLLFGSYFEELYEF